MLSKMLGSRHPWSVCIRVFYWLALLCCFDICASLLCLYAAFERHGRQLFCPPCPLSALLLGRRPGLSFEAHLRRDGVDSPLMQEAVASE